MVDINDYEDVKLSLAKTLEEGTYDPTHYPLSASLVLFKAIEPLIREREVRAWKAGYDAGHKDGTDSGMFGYSPENNKNPYEEESE